VRTSLRITGALTGKDYVQANRVRTLAIEAVKDLFSSVDIVVTPTTAQPAPRYFYYLYFRRNRFLISK
jgi:aspartyl-tRNA(Asn)/glutamyl-tRNA(Gln) amidotransferase subunit A